MDEKYLRPGFPFALAHAVEEAGEFVATAGKLLRWGPYSYNPELPENEREYNIDAVRRELHDMLAAGNRLNIAIKEEFNASTS